MYSTNIGCYWYLFNIALKAVELFPIKLPKTAQREEQDWSQLGPDSYLSSSTHGLMTLGKSFPDLSYFILWNRYNITYLAGLF